MESITNHYWLSLFSLDLNLYSKFQTVTMSSQWLCGLLVILTVSYGVYGQGLSEEEKEEILNAHNHYRGLVDPIAGNMLKMVRLVRKWSMQWPSQEFAKGGARAREIYGPAHFLWPRAPSIVMLRLLYYPKFAQNCHARIVYS